MFYKVFRWISWNLHEIHMKSARFHEIRKIQEYEFLGDHQV